MRAFTRQDESYNRAAVTRLPETLDRLIDVAAPRSGERWLDAACGPGIVTRALAAGAGEVLGIDATPAMVEVARREAAAAGAGNVRFAVGDITDLDLADASFDAAICRFALHHVPVPERALAELRRVVRPGGVVVVADHLADDDAGALAWSQAIERLRDPSHWMCLTQPRLRGIGARLGMALDREEVLPVALDYEDWLARGPGSAGAAEAIRWSFAQRPEQSSCFAVAGGLLSLRLWIGRWRR